MEISINTEGDKMVYLFSLTNFAFPSGLQDDKANFRFVFELRHVNEKKQAVTVNSVSPGAETFFECDRDKEEETVKNDDLDEHYYVRDDSLPKFAIDKVQDWHKLVLMVNSQKLIGMRLKVLDVDREGLWEKFKEVISALVGALIGRATSSDAIPDIIAQPVATASEQFQTWLTDKMAGKHKVIFREYVDLTRKAPGDTVQFTGTGYKGDYTLDLNLTKPTGSTATSVANAVRDVSS